jgi:hypothetical protein
MSSARRAFSGITSGCEGLCEEIILRTSLVGSNKKGAGTLLRHLPLRELAPSEIAGELSARTDGRDCYSRHDRDLVWTTPLTEYVRDSVPSDALTSVQETLQ